MPQTNGYDLLTQDEVAEILAVRPDTLNTWRYKKVGPKYIKSGKTVRYRRSDLDAWIEQRTVETN